MQTELTRKINSFKEKQNASIKAEARIVLQKYMGDVNKMFSKLISVDDLNVKEIIRNSNLEPERRDKLLQYLTHFALHMKNENYTEAKKSANAIVGLSNYIHDVEHYDLLRALKINFRCFHSIFEQREKFENGTLKPKEVFSENIAERIATLKDYAALNEKFFANYAHKNKDSIFSSYTANKGKLSEKCSALMKSIQNKVGSNQYQDTADVERDIQVLDKLREEYTKVFQDARNTSKVFKPKGTGEFATHMNKQMVELRNDLGLLQTALQHANKFKK